MEANELRIGNLLHFPFTGENAEVLGINAHEYSEGIYNTISYKKGINLYCEKIEVLKPITLTEEWLLKFGLEYLSPFGYKIKRGSFIKHDLETNGYYFRWNGQTISLMYYVHELQNLYFALTGEELTIKNQE
jgi:hypothetical protein